MLQVGGRSVVCKEVEQYVAILEDDAKFFKLLELLGLYSPLGSIIVFVDKQENADSLLKDLMKASYSCMSLHGGETYYFEQSKLTNNKVFTFADYRDLLPSSCSSYGVNRQNLLN